MQANTSEWNQFWFERKVKESTQEACLKLLTRFICNKNEPNETTTNVRNVKTMALFVSVKRIANLTRWGE